MQRVTRVDDKNWQLQQPIKSEADRVIMGELARLFAGLKALRFVADLDTPEYGFDPPYAVVTAHFTLSSRDKQKSTQETKSTTETQTYTLKLGNKTDNGRFAQFGRDRAVFVVENALSKQIDEPVISRTMLGTPLEQIMSIRIDSKGSSMKVERRGERFEVVGSKKVDDTRAKDLAEQIARLRASSATAYGDSSAEEGTSNPKARIAISRKPDSPPPVTYELLVGDKAPSLDNRDQVYVRRGDLPVGFTLPLTVVDDLLAFVE